MNVRLLSCQSERPLRLNTVRERGHVGFGAELDSHNVGGDDFDLVRLAINKCWRQ